MSGTAAGPRRYRGCVDTLDWDAALTPHVAGRRVILAGGPVAQWTDSVRDHRRLGASAVFVLGTGSVGTGPLPEQDECETHVVDLPDAPTLIERIRLSLAVLADPPPEVTARLDVFDPDGTALVVGDFLNTAPALGSRRFFAYRRPEWVALEDKVTVDALWERAGVAHAPSVVVTADIVSVSAAAAELGGTVVLAGDAREGWHGGASLVRWADDASRLERAVESLAPHCDHVRVMPYLEGIPCSIHGIVLPDGVCALRPVEMVVSRKPDGTFFYAGCATFFDPPSWVREEMRAAARRVGEHLRGEVDFRGAFTVDGVATVDGFLPTELNPRCGAGLMQIARAAEVPMSMLLDLVVAGAALPWSVAEVEAVVLAAADATRRGGTWSGVHGVEREAGEWQLSLREGTWHEASSDEPVDVVVTAGPAHGGTFVRAVFEADRTPVGPPVATRAAAVWAWADELLGLGIGPLQPATET